VVLTIVIKDVPNVERVDQWHVELGAILSKLSHAVSQTGVPLPEKVIDRNGFVVGELTWGPDVFSATSEQRRAELEAAKIARLAMTEEDQLKVKKYMEEAG
jgi:hypothetical protein